MTHFNHLKIGVSLSSNFLDCRQISFLYKVYLQSNDDFAFFCCPPRRWCGWSVASNKNFYLLSHGLLANFHNTNGYTKLIDNKKLTRTKTTLRCLFSR